MIDINWNNFKAKFNGQEHKTFEQLCYLLFCKEFNIDTGIFRYKNQTGIETEPIEHEGKLVGFQSKFYETKISENKDDIKNSITKAKNKNPNLDKIFFYLNQEFPESSKQKTKTPAFKKEIEKHAETQHIEIEWRVPSHFEIQLAIPSNKSIAQHYFSQGKSSIDFINELIHHTELILRSIHSKIIFKDVEIKIDRSLIIGSLKNTLDQSSIVVLTGEGGTGKTAVIKDFYETAKNKTPFFVFKASEFNIANINQLFANYGSFTLMDFIKEHQEINEKYIVIDSAEKLSEIKQQEVFQEFLSGLIDNHWKIIFTTRYGYLDDLRFQFIEIYHTEFKSLKIENLSDVDVEQLSRIHKFDLPDNPKLLALILNPFYLNEYLNNYENIINAISHSEFKQILWNKTISKTSFRENNIHIKRENCFIEIAHMRAISGSLFVKADCFDKEAIRGLENDEIIKYDSISGGYFITQDIYEEWALDKSIERNYRCSRNYSTFFKNIGNSLPIRRAFRLWLSEKMINDIEDVRDLIETTINDINIETCWKDEVYISIMLSDYSKIFFQSFYDKLIENNQRLLTRIIFLLRIACKEVDENFLKLLGIRKTDNVALNTIYTHPKGKGWNCVIDFIHKYKSDFNLNIINVILPLLQDWNNKNKTGDTTKKAGQIALYYYDELIKNDKLRYSYRNTIEKQLINIILNGASETTKELTAIFDEIISSNLTNHTDKYYNLVKTILTSLDCFEVVKCLPDYVIKLADLFWFHDSTNIGRYGYGTRDVDHYFGLSGKHDFDYFPASAFQTPAFQLLRFAPTKAVNFILSFTNKCVEYYANSGFDQKPEEVDVFIDGDTQIRQYIDNRIWNMYRGTQVTTHLLESLHMALEKWLLENAKATSKEILEEWCIYLLKNSKSASISAVITSVVLAYPFKLFNVARILFRTKEFFIHDTTRLSTERTAKGLYSMGIGFNPERELFENERTKTCDDAHRKLALEYLALTYQVFKSEDDSQEDFKKRQDIVWKILDTYYAELPEQSLETESDKMWRLYLARMDRRKMNPKAEEKDGQVIIQWNPQIDPELQKYSDGAINQSTASMKHIPLNLWADSRFRKDKDAYEKYPQYEDNPQLVVSETKEILERLSKQKEDNYALFNRSIPAFTCTVLIRDFWEQLNSDDGMFCRDVVLEYASLPFISEQYFYQISDGIEPAISILPEVLKHFPKTKEDVTVLLLLLLISYHHEMSIFATRSILNSLWKNDPEVGHVIFCGYLFLKPKFDAFFEELQKENFKKGIYKFSEKQVINSFVETYNKEFKDVISKNINYSYLSNLESLDLETLNTAFELIPAKTENEDHKDFLNLIFPVISEKLCKDDKDDIHEDHNLKNRFLNKYAHFILSSDIKEIEIYLKPFIDRFENSRNMADFFQEFVSVEDYLNQYEAFWAVWEAFYSKIVDMCKNDGQYRYADEIIHNYLLAWPYWKKDAKEWHSLKDREKTFFQKVSKDIGHLPSVLFSISKVLNGIGSNFIEDGIAWLCDILKNNDHLFTEELEVNTDYYIENVIRRYILTKRSRIKSSLRIKNAVVTILNFLVEKGSTAGYLLREDIL